MGMRKKGRNKFKAEAKIQRLKIAQARSKRLKKAAEAKKAA
jgi:hypothetical protein